VDTPRKSDWHGAKAARTEAERGIAFEFAAAVFADPTRVDFDVSRPEQGEERRKTIGRIGKRLFTVVYTMRARQRGSSRPAPQTGRRNALMATVRFTPDPNNPPRLTPEQEARLDAMTEEEIEAIAASDPDNPPSTEEELARGVFARDVRLARKTLGLSQEAFAAALGLPVATLRNWEQGRFNPDPAARALVRLVKDDPARAVRVLAPAE
jgi:putative transcriptional regulator